MINDSSGVILPIFKYLNIYISKSTMGYVYPLKGPSSDSMTCSENLKFNPISVNRSCFKITSYLPLAESFTWNLHVTAFFELSASHVKSTLTWWLLVILTACVCHCITEYLPGCGFSTRPPVTIIKLHPMSNKGWNLLNLALPCLLLTHLCKIVE